MVMMIVKLTLEKRRFSSPYSKKTLQPANPRLTYVSTAISVRLNTMTLQLPPLFKRLVPSRGKVVMSSLCLRFAFLSRAPVIDTVAA